MQRQFYLSVAAVSCCQHYSVFFGQCRGDTASAACYPCRST